MVAINATSSAARPGARPSVLPSALHATVLDWYASNARDLPWRTPAASAWAVMVSEFMLQQTPVAAFQQVAGQFELELDRDQHLADAVMQFT